MHNRSGAMMDVFGSSLDELMPLTPEQQTFIDAQIPNLMNLFKPSMVTKSASFQPSTWKTTQG